MTGKNALTEIRDFLFKEISKANSVFAEDFKNMAKFNHDIKTKEIFVTYDFTGKDDEKSIFLIAINKFIDERGPAN